MRSTVQETIPREQKNRYQRPRTSGKRWRTRWQTNTIQILRGSSNTESNKAPKLDEIPNELMKS